MVCVVIAVAGMVSSSCRKEKEPTGSMVVLKANPASASPDLGGGAVQAPAPPPPPTPGEGAATPAATDEPTGTVSLEKLNWALREYLHISPTVPDDLAELYRARLIPKVPIPPPGKKYVVDKKKVRVTLADQ